MTSDATIRDPQTDRLLTPKNAALLVIDYQPVQVGSIKSMDRDLMIHNMIKVIETAKLYQLPIILSTVNVATGRNKDTIPELQSVFSENQVTLDRTSINAWEDQEFRAAVGATGRKKLLMTALWTEACLTFPGLDAMAEGFEVYPIVDAVGGTSVTAHETALRRLEQGGAHLTSWVQVICELQRDWNRTDTVHPFTQILFDAK